MCQAGLGRWPDAHLFGGKPFVAGCRERTTHVIHLSARTTYDRWGSSRANSRLLFIVPSARLLRALIAPNLGRAVKKPPNRRSRSVARAGTLLDSAAELRLLHSAPRLAHRLLYTRQVCREWKVCSSPIRAILPEREEACSIGAGYHVAGANLFLAPAERTMASVALRR